MIKNIDEGKFCCMVFCDLSKAFDRVWHKGLLFKLKTYGLCGNILTWIESYLCNRRQKVMYKDIFSSNRNINAGVPQESVLGPLLFLIYVNDVSENMISLCRLFADDNSLQSSSYNVATIEYTLNHDLDILDKWSSKWLMKFNPSKTKALFFTLKSNYYLPKLQFQRCNLEYITSHKHLGLLLSQNLNWSDHIDNIVKQAYQRLGLLKKLKYNIGRKTLSKMYITFIRPLLEYCSIVWDGCSLQDVERLEMVQLYAARIITGLPIIASRDALYLETGWEPLADRRKVAKLNTMYKVHHNLVPDYLKSIFPATRRNESKYDTRNREDYTIPRCRLEIFKKSFVPDTINQWNSLSITTRNSISFSSFKNNIHKKPADPPSYFSHGNRRLNIIHTKLRHNCILNYDLYRRNIIESPNCSCGTPEDPYHFFFVCNKYQYAREKLFRDLLCLTKPNIKLNIIDCHLLLWGDESQNVEINKYIFQSVHKFIRDSGRFN